MSALLNYKIRDMENFLRNCEWLFEILNTTRFGLGSMSISIAHLYAFDENLRYEISQLRTAHMIFSKKCGVQDLHMIYSYIFFLDVNICVLLSKILIVAAANAELII